MNLAKRLMVFWSPAVTNVLTWLKEKINEHSKLVYVLLVMLGFGIMATGPSVLRIDQLLTSSAVSAPMKEEEGKWERLADMPTPRYNHSIAIIDNKIYVIGGTTFNGMIVNDNEVYDTILNKWEKKEPMPTKRAAITTTVVEGKIYAIGGSILGDIVIVPTVEVYDPITNKWEKKKDMPEPKYFHSAIPINEKIYIFGGSTTNNTVSPSIFIYDTINDNWEKLSDTPENYHMDGSVAINYGEEIYFFGGANMFRWAINQNLFSFRLFDNTWHTKASYITPRYVPAAGRIGEEVYLIGGVLGGNGQNVEVYNFKTNKWRKIENIMPTPRGYFGTSMSCAVVDNKIYIIGGSFNIPNALSANEAFILNINKIGVTNGEKLLTTWGTLKQVVKKGN